MRRSIRDSLTIKIFLITCVLLVAVCMLTYTFIVTFMPNTYFSFISEDLREDALGLIGDLTAIRLEDSGELLSEFSAANQVSLSVVDSEGDLIEIPEYIDSFAEETEVTGKSGSADDASDILSQSYPFSFASADQQYKLLIIGSVQIVNDAAIVMGKILPYLLILILLMSLLVSWMYSRYITRPIIKLSQISENMSKLEFGWQNDKARRDEIGNLSANISKLSQKLRVTLEELRAANRSLQEEIELKQNRERMRIAFFMSVSHELKTPITVIKGQAEGMLHNVGVYQDHNKYLKRLYEVTCGMEEVVQELLTVSRLESSDFTLSVSEFDFTRLISESLDSHEDILISKKIAVSPYIDENLIMEADQALLKKVLNNLISNAANYSPSGSSIIINAHRMNETIRFEIENSGVKIPGEFLPKIFDPFCRVEQFGNRRAGGSGMGLYIVKTILDLHEAEYRIENTNNGVRFTFELNIK